MMISAEWIMTLAGFILSILIFSLIFGDNGLFPLRRFDLKRRDRGRADPDPDRKSLLAVPDPAAAGRSG